MGKHVPPPTEHTDHVAVLVEVRKALKDEDHWCRKVLGRDANGKQINRHELKSPRVAQMCLMGAVERFSESFRLFSSNGSSSSARPSVRANARFLLDRAVLQYRPVFYAHSRSEPGSAVEHFNDDQATTHKDVLAVIDIAIELGKEQRS